SLRGRAAVPKSRRVRVSPSPKCFQTTIAPPNTISTRTAYAANHDSLCNRTPSRGSIKNGYASKASRLPELLTAERKYGSRPEVGLVFDNQFCRRGAVVDTTPNGIPTDLISWPSNHNVGWLDAAASGLVAKCMGRKMIASIIRHACASICALTFA